MAPVAAVRLVRPLSREYDLHLLGGEARQLEQRRRARDAAGLLEPGHRPGELGEEVRLLHRRAVVARADQAGVSAAGPRSSSTSPWPGKPIVNVVGGSVARTAIAATTAAESTPPERNAP